MTFTKEWLQQKISEMESRRDDPWLGLDEDESNTLEALKLALSSLEAEPVAWLLSGGGVKNNVSFDSGNAYADPLREVTPLYTAPPAPVSMKDHQIRELVNELRDIAVEYHGTQQLRERIARTIRAAMLQGKAETVSQRLGGVHAKNEPHKLIGAGDIPYGGAGDDLTSRGKGAGKVIQEDIDVWNNPIAKFNRKVK